jgi:hypothetical protein
LKQQSRTCSSSSSTHRTTASSPQKLPHQCICQHLHVSSSIRHQQRLLGTWPWQRQRTLHALQL